MRTGGESQSFDIAFLIHYVGTGAPYDVTLGLNDYRRQYRSVVIREITVAYDDGETIQETDELTYRFEEYPAAELNQTEIKIENLIRRERDATLTIRGELHGVDGSVEPLILRHRLEHSRESQTGTWIEWLRSA